MKYADAPIFALVPCRGVATFVIFAVARFHKSPNELFTNHRAEWLQITEWLTWFKPAFLCWDSFKPRNTRNVRNNQTPIYLRRTCIIYPIRTKGFWKQQKQRKRIVEIAKYQCPLGVRCCFLTGLTEWNRIAQRIM